VTDFELLPRSLAEKFREDDRQVAVTGEPMLRIIEVFVNRRGLPGWFLTNKMPIRSKAGQVIGVMGTNQQYESHGEILPADLDIAPALDYLGGNFTENAAIFELAKLAGMTVRQLELKFQKHLQTRPRSFHMRMRVLSPATPSCGRGSRSERLPPTSASMIKPPTLDSLRSTWG